MVPLTELLNKIGIVSSLLHNAWLPGCAKSGIGFTVIVKVFETPGQLLATGETVMVAVTGDELLLIAVNEGISPVPLAANPMDVLLLVQLYKVPMTAPLKLTALVVAPLHKTWLPGCNTSGVGLTVMVKVFTGPEQPFAMEFTVIVAVTGDPELLIAVNGEIFPEPEAANPMEVLSFVQL